MKLKQTILITLIIVSIIANSMMISATENADYDISLLKYDPIPAQPGQYIDAYIQITNTGNEDGSKCALEIENNFPFKTISEDDKYQELGIIKSQQSLVKTIKLRVSKDAIIGVNELKVKIYPETSNKNRWKETKLYIMIKPNRASLSIDKVDTKPEEISPGKEGLIKITVKNDEDITLRDISLKLELKKIISNSINDIPLIPINSATEKQITKLNPGEKNSFEFNIKIYPEAEPGFYKIPINIKYYDDKGEETSKEEYIGLIVKAEPELEVYLEKNGIDTKTQSGNIKLKFINKGINDLKFLDVKILKNEEYEVISNKQKYIGDLDSDDYRTEEFTIKLLKNPATIDIKTTYKDDNNIEYEVNKQITVSAKDQNQKENHTSTIILILVLIGIVLFGILKIKKKK